MKNVIEMIMALLCIAGMIQAESDDWQELSNQVFQLVQEKKYEQALPVAEEALKKTIERFGDSDTTLFCLNNLGIIYQNLDRYQDAESCYQRVIAIRERTLGADHPKVAEALDNLAVLYYNLSRYSETVSLFQRALTIREKKMGENHQDVATTLSNLSATYDNLGRYSEAEISAKRALIITERIYGSDHPEVAVCLTNLGDLKLKMGHYTSAESLYQRALDITIKFWGDHHSNVVTCLNNLVYLYQTQGRYTEAEEYCQQEIEILESSMEPDSSSMAISRMNLAAVYDSQGRYTEAAELYLSALEICRKVHGAVHPNVARCLNNLAVTYRHIPEKIVQVEPLYQHALEINRSFFRGDHMLIAQNLTNLGTFYLSRKRYTEAEPLFTQARAMIERLFGQDALELTTIMNSQAVLYEYLGRLSEAESLYVNALALKRKWLGPDHPVLVVYLSNLAIYYYLQGRLNDADQLMDECLANLASQFNRFFPYYSEQDKLDYLNRFREIFSKYYSYAYRAYPTDPQISGKMLNLSLWRKGMIVSSQSAVIRRISSQADTSAVGILHQLRSTREELAKLYLSMTDISSVNRKRQAELEQESEELERRLSRMTNLSIHSPRIDSIEWQDIAADLKPNEAAIDFLAFRLYNQHWTDTIVYGALIVTHACPHPTMVIVGTESQLNHVINYEYKSMIRQQPYYRFDQPGRLYEMIWKPLEPYLDGIDKIYLSPDGMLNSISFGILVNRQGKMLIDDYNLCYLSNLSDLLQHHTTDSLSRDWVLIGNPIFKADETEVREIWKVENLPTDSTRRSSRLEDLAGDHLPELPWTQTEIDSIRSLLQSAHRPVTVFTKLQATEENLKSLHSPKVLHIATHGFFLPVTDREDSVLAGDKEQEIDKFMENPLLRSGLFLAGASNRLAERGLNDGILTAYEAADLDLMGTELVVLSACETGVGEVMTGEGVYGLRRAFQIAGAKTVMMSLWPVPDQETQELMTRFYQKLLHHTDPYTALRTAQMEQREIVRERYRQDIPFYWGAFIMVGGRSGF